MQIAEMMILPAMSRVAIHFSAPQKRKLDQVTLTDIEHYHSEGHFRAGSMGPKADAIARFLEGGGKRADHREIGKCAAGPARRDRHAHYCRSGMSRRRRAQPVNCRCDFHDADEGHGDFGLAVYAGAVKSPP